VGAGSLQVPMHMPIGTTCEGADVNGNTDANIETVEHDGN